MKLDKRPNSCFITEMPLLWEVEAKVCDITVDQLQVDREEAGPTARIVEDLGCDSLDLVELMMAIEEAFDVKLPDEEAQQLFVGESWTFRHVAQWVRMRWDTERRERAEWTAPRVTFEFAETAPFTQMSGRLTDREWRDGSRYEALSANREGCRQFRRTTDGMRCVWIPEADVWIGSADPDALPDQRPPHRVRLTSFLIDAEPVTNAAYARFLNSIWKVPPEVLQEWCGVEPGSRRHEHYPLHLERGRWEPVRGTEKQPMILVSWYGANAYSLWANRRDWRDYKGVTPEMSFLPTEAQWEYAARGESARDRAYGEEDDAGESGGGVAVVARHRIGAAYAVETLPAAPVNERRGMSPFGLHHMSGNVWQWCRDWYTPDFYRNTEPGCSDPVAAHPTGIRSERGGSWVGPESLASPAYRRGRAPSLRGRCLGFRCVGRVEDLPEGDRLYTH